MWIQANTEIKLPDFQYHFCKVCVHDNDYFRITRPLNYKNFHIHKNFSNIIGSL
jgi:hypothetical protein